MVVDVVFESGWVYLHERKAIIFCRFSWKNQESELIKQISLKVVRYTEVWAAIKHKFGFNFKMNVVVICFKLFFVLRELNYYASKMH